MNPRNLPVNILSVVLVQLILLHSLAPLRAEQAGAGQAQVAPMLRIVILEGEGAINNIRQRTAREAIVQVQDENNRPVSGAAVTFLLPNSGPSGTFANGSKLLTVVTDDKGQAVMRGLQPNKVAGELKVNVSASHLGQTATATITQSNALVGAAVAGAAAGAGISAKVIAIVVAVAAAGAAGGAVAATRGNGSPAAASAQPTVITPGTPVFGTPR